MGEIYTNRDRQNAKEEGQKVIEVALTMND